MSESESSQNEGHPLNPEEFTDPYHHLIPVLDGEVDAGEYVTYHRDAIVIRRETSRNLWSFRIEEKDVVTFDADEFQTTNELGQYLDGVLSFLSGQESDSEDVETGLGDMYGAGAFQ